MFCVGNLLSFKPYYFSNGAKPKNKYFIVIATFDTNLIIASLPTSQDHIPGHITKNHGCLDSPKDNVNCYYFAKMRPICTNGYCFPEETYLYGEQVFTVPLDVLSSNHPSLEGVSLRGQLLDDEYNSILECFKSSTAVKRKIKRLLETI